MRKSSGIVFGLAVLLAFQIGLGLALAATSVDMARSALGFWLALPDRWQLLRQDFDPTHGLLAEVNDTQNAAYLIVVASTPDPAFATVETWLEAGEMPIALQYYATDGKRLQGQNYEIVSQSAPVQIKVATGETATLRKMSIKADGKPRNVAFISGAGPEARSWYYVLVGNATTPAALEEALPTIAAGIHLH